MFLTYLVPDSLLFLPLFKVVGAFGLLDSYWGLILVYPTLTVPFCTWIMIGYFQSIPRSCDEAALIDGANHVQMLFKIFIPVALPGLIAATIFAFTVSWAAFVYPMAFIYSSDQLVLHGRHDHQPGQGRCLSMGHDHDRGAVRGGAAAHHLRLPHGLLHRRPHRRRDEGISAMAQVTLNKVVKKFADLEVVHGIDLEIADQEFVVLVGPSGCGKSTTLRMIAGLEETSDGEIYIGGAARQRRAAKDRDIAMVFQNYALYPHMTVFENMSFGLKLQEIPQGGDQAAGRAMPRASSTSPSSWSGGPGSSPAASASASPWAAPSCAIPRSFCSTSRSPTSTPSCACRCAPRSRRCISRSAPRRSTSRTTRSRR